MAESTQSILVIDDHPMFRKGVLQLIDSAFRVVGEASSGAEGIAMAIRLAPDLVLLDLNMKDMSGIDVLKTLKATELESRVIMLTVSDHEDDLLAALRGGADGYLLKDSEPVELLAQLQSAAAGKLVLSEQLTGLLAHAIRQDSRPQNPDKAGLTEQERRILDQIAAGKSNKLIARELGIAEGTVKVHVKHILKKLDVRSRVEAAVLAVEYVGKRRAGPGAQ